MSSSISFEDFLEITTFVGRSILPFRVYPLEYSSITVFSSCSSDSCWFNTSCKLGSKGFSNALVTDANGNVAETATANIFMIKDGDIFTPIPNGTFLAGITRSRHIKNLKDYGRNIFETVLSFEDFYGADEVFMSGNMTKITPVTALEDKNFQVGPITQLARELYWDWSKSEAL